MIVVCSTSQLLLNDILSKAGPSVQQEYTNATASSQPDLYEIYGRNLKCRKILFKSWGFRDKTSKAFYQSIRQFVRHSVQCAIKHQHTSIASPAIGCGKINANKNSVAKEMLFEAQQRLLAANVLLQIIFVILPHQKNVFDIFQAELDPLQTGNVGSNSSQVCHPLTSKHSTKELKQENK